MDAHLKSATTSSSSSITRKHGSCPWTTIIFDPPLPRNEEAVSVRPTETRCGLGVFTHRALPARHRIILERPAISCIFWRQRKGRRTIGEEWERLKPERREELRCQFRLLADVPDILKSKDRRRLKRFVENYAFWDPQQSDAHVFYLASHINHACTACANAEQWISSEHLIHVRIVKPLEAGAEVLINYNRSKLPFGCAVCNQGGMRSFTRAVRNFILR